MQSGSIKLFVNKYSAVGEERFYKFLISYALNRFVEPLEPGYDPAIELIEHYEVFLKLYRKEGKNIYLDLARIFRKAGHKIYRVGLKRGVAGKNNKFLNLI